MQSIYDRVYEFYDCDNRILKLGFRNILNRVANVVKEKMHFVFKNNTSISFFLVFSFYGAVLFSLLL